MRKIRAFCEKLFKICNDISSVLVLLSVCFIIVNVFMRLFFRRPFLGAIETVQYFTLCMVSLGLAYCNSSDGHTRVDIVLENVPKKVELLLNIITQIISVVGMCFVVTNLVRMARIKAANFEVSGTLRIPISLLYYVIVAGIVMLTLSILFKLIDSFCSLIRPGETPDAGEQKSISE